MGAGAFDGIDIDALDGCQTPCQRACLYASAIGAGGRWCCRRCSGGGFGGSFDFGWGRIFLCGGCRRGISLWRGRGVAGRFRDAARIFSVFGQHHDDRVDLYTLSSGIDQNMRDRALINGFDFHRCFVGFDLSDDIAAAHLIARFDEPFGKRALFHRGAKRGHGDVDGHLVVYLFYAAR